LRKGPRGPKGPQHKAGASKRPVAGEIREAEWPKGHGQAYQGQKSHFRGYKGRLRPLEACD